MKQIQNLQQTLKKLEKQKQEKLKSIYQFRCESSTINSQRHPYKSREVFISGEGSSSSNSVNAFSTPRPTVAFQSWYSSNVVLNICGDEAQFCICATRKPGLLTTVAFVMEKHSIALIYANIFCNGIGYMIQAHVSFKLHPHFIMHFIFLSLYLRIMFLTMMNNLCKIQGSWTSY